MSVFDAFMKFLAGRNFFGRANPRNKPRPLPAYDARTHALYRFADFLAALEWSKPGNEGEADIPSCPRCPNLDKPEVRHGFQTGATSKDLGDR